MDMYELITCRHSERKFTNDNVSKEYINKIIDAGLSAPSGQNTQPWHFTVIQSAEVQNKLVNICKKKFLEVGQDWRRNWANMDNFNPFYAPNVIIVVSNNNTIINSNEDCCFALQNMTLMAEDLGLSSCIIKDICWAIDKDNQEEYGIPKEFDCFMCLAVGYAKKRNRNKKKLDYSKINYIV